MPTLPYVSGPEPGSLAMFLAMSGPQPPQPPLAGPPEGRLPGLVSAADLINAPKRRPSFLVQGLLVERTVNLAVGNSGIGKTPLLVQLGLCVAAGLPFLGLDTAANGRPVLFVDAETGKEQMETYVQTLAGFLELPADVPLEVYSANWSPRPPGCVGLHAAVEYYCRHLQPQLVIFDCLRPLWPGIEKDSQLAAEMWRWKRQLAVTHDLTTLTVHHLRKPTTDKEGNPTGPSLASDPRGWLTEAAGTMALINQADTRLGIDFSSQLSEHQLLFGGFSKATGDITPYEFDRVLDADGDPLGYAPAHQRLWGVMRQDFRTALQQLKPEFRFADVRGVLAATGGQANDSTVKRFLEQMLNCGVLRKGTGPNGKPIYHKQLQHQRTLDTLRHP